jgi:maltose/moltooligosaccharide transporter
MLPWMLTRWFGVSNEAPPGQIPASVRFSFYLGAAAFLIAVVWTVVTSKEYSPEEMKSFGITATPDSHGGALRTIVHDLFAMPRTMQQLALAQFFSWFALFAMWIYTTTAVTTHIYHTTDPTSALYNDGANWVGVCFAVYNGVAALVAFGIPPLARWSSPKMAHIVCLACGALGLLSITMVSDPKYLLVSMIGVGIAWASILSMPYAILTGALPPAKLGYYMGVFNFFIVIPQIVAAAILGYLVKHFFGGDTLYAIVVGGASLLVAAVLMFRVKESQ